jgi:hypothetical protein
MGSQQGKRLAGGTFDNLSTPAKISRDYHPQKKEQP